ncbi:MAG: DNA gyrase inhibitor YacG [Oceanicaulis sp.]
MSDAKSKTLPPCPMCKRPGLHEFRPFCSRRCADADLGNWFSGAYAVPGDPVDPEALAPGERDADD